jgi:hypothetical protein
LIACARAPESTDRHPRSGTAHTKRNSIQGVALLFLATRVDEAHTMSSRATLNPPNLTPVSKRKSRESHFRGCTKSQRANSLGAATNDVCSSSQHMPAAPCLHPLPPSCKTFSAPSVHALQQTTPTKQQTKLHVVVLRAAPFSTSNQRQVSAQNLGSILRSQGGMGCTRGKIYTYISYMKVMTSDVLTYDVCPCC